MRVDWIGLLTVARAEGAGGAVFLEGAGVRGEQQQRLAHSRRVAHLHGHVERARGLHCRALLVRPLPPRRYCLTSSACSCVAPVALFSFFCFCLKSLFVRTMQ